MCFCAFYYAFNIIKLLMKKINLRSNNYLYFLPFYYWTYIFIELNFVIKDNDCIQLSQHVQFD